MPRVFALADTHLGEAVGKTMDRFGDHWRGHKAKLMQNSWRTADAPDDVLLLPGDLSWALRRPDAEPDLAFLASLPGIKVAIKGNHDHWWDSKKPVDYPGLSSPPQVLFDGKLGIAGTRGWFVPDPGAEGEANDRKILERERERLRRSLVAIADCPLKIAMLHYPPHPFLPELKEARVHAVAYGHIHRNSPPEAEAQAHDGEEFDGIPFYCVACDRIDFTPRQIAEF